MNNYHCKFVLVYGPSGIGKTTAIRAVVMTEISQAVFASLDDVTADLGRRHGLIGHDQGAGDLLPKLRADGFLGMGIKAAEELAERNRERFVVLDVGAGFLESKAAGSWLANQESIVFLASNEVAYARQRKRHPGETRTLEQYSRQEFSPHRLAFYNLAKHRVDAAGSEEDVSSSLRRILSDLMQSGSVTDGP